MYINEIYNLNTHHVKWIHIFFPKESLTVVVLLFHSVKIYQFALLGYVSTILYISLSMAKKTFTCLKSIMFKCFPMVINLR